MREVKFRAWDSINKNMRYDIAMVDFEKNRIGFKNPEKRLVSENYREFWDLPYELMQYTGLKDINGMEIYEGDVCESVLGIKGIVIFDKGAYKLKSKQSMYGISKLPKVIGNIYENPELLEGK